MKMRTILYTDGGARPNPGKIGSGVHGYTYDINSTDTVAFVHNFTGIGYKTSDEMAAEGAPRRVRPVRLHDYSFSYNEQGTNNIAEVMAIILGVTNVMADDVEGRCKDFLIFSDSQTSISIINGVRANYDNFCRRSSMKPDLLKQVKTFVDKLKEENVKVKIDHIKAHSFHYGNQLADVYATLGLTNGVTRIFNNDLKGYLSPPKGDNPLLKAKYVYFDTHEHIPGTYRLITLKEEGWTGRVDPKTNSFGIYFGEPNEAVDACIAKLEEQVPQVFSSVVTIPNLFNPKNTRIRNLFGNEAFMAINHNVIGIGEGADKKDNTNIVSNVIMPSALSNETKNQFKICEMVERNFESKKVFEYIDITDILYTEEKPNGIRFVNRGINKVIFKYKPTFKNEKSFSTNFHLHIGGELPTLNQLNKNTLKKPARVYLCVLWTGVKCDFATLMTYGDNEKLVTTNAGCSIIRK